MPHKHSWHNYIGRTLTLPAKVFLYGAGLRSRPHDLDNVLKKTGLQENNDELTKRNAKISKKFYAHRTTGKKMSNSGYHHGYHVKGAITYHGKNHVKKRKFEHGLVTPSKAEADGYSAATAHQSHNEEDRKFEGQLIAKYRNHHKAAKRPNALRQIISSLSPTLTWQRRQQISNGLDGTAGIQNTWDLASTEFTAEATSTGGGQIATLWTTNEVIGVVSKYLNDVNNIAERTSDYDRSVLQSARELKQYNTLHIEKCKRTYTFLNTSNAISHWRCFQLCYKKDCTNLISPVGIWTTDLSFNDNLINAIAVPTSAANQIWNLDTSMANTNPTTKCKSFSETFRIEAIDTFEIAAGQKFEYHAYIPAINIHQDQIKGTTNWSAAGAAGTTCLALGGITRTWMFIGQGQLCYDDSTADAPILGPGAVHVSMKVEDVFKIKMCMKIRNYYEIMTPITFANTYTLPQETAEIEPTMVTTKIIDDNNEFPQENAIGADNAG